jgi:hypothetical protein
MHLLRFMYQITYQLWLLQENDTNAGGTSLQGSDLQAGTLFDLSSNSTNPLNLSASDDADGLLKRRFTNARKTTCCR